MTTPNGTTSAAWSARLDAVFFVLGGLAAVWLAYLTLQEGIRPGWPVLLLVVFWLLVAYLALPRLHRILTHVYVPDYFIGRTRTADGLLGDPVNLALDGTEGQIHHALQNAGWTLADPLSLRSGGRIVTSTLSRRSYPQAPVSPLFLFGRQQDFAYQQEIAGNPSQRHHVRFWRCPDGWLLPGGLAVDWLAAGTYDRSVGLSLFTLQITHKIGQDVDAERDHIVDSVVRHNPSATVRRMRDFFTGYHSRNGGGDVMVTDGHLPVLDVNGLDDSGELIVPSGVTRPRRPPQVTFGVVVTGLRALAYLVIAALVLGGQQADATQTPAGVSATALVVIYLLAGLADLVLAIATLAGYNWSRLLLCALSLLNIGSVFIARGLENQHSPLHASLIPVGISVLVLLALSSRAARNFARA